MKLHAPLPEKLGRILEKEYAVLLRGDLDDIEKVAAEKSLLLEKISNLPTGDIKAFAHLRGILRRNHMLTHSAIDGIRAAILRTKEVSDVTNVLRTYDSNGKKSDVTMQAGRFLSKRS